MDSGYSCHGNIGQIVQKVFRNEQGMLHGNCKIQDPWGLVLMLCCGHIGISN